MVVPSALLCLCAALAFAISTNASDPPLPRWPLCPEVEGQPGTVAARTDLIRTGLQLGLDRLWRRLRADDALFGPEPGSHVGSKPIVLSILGGALAEMDLHGNLTATELLLRLAFRHQRQADEPRPGYLPWLPTDMQNTTWDGHGTLLGFLQLVPLLYVHGAPSRDPNPDPDPDPDPNRYVGRECPVHGGPPRDPNPNSNPN